MKRVAVALAVLGAGCADDLCAGVDGSCIELEVRGAGPVDRIDQIVLDSVELGLSFARSPEIAQKEVALPVRLAVRPLAHQGSFALDVEGRLRGQSVGKDRVFSTIFAGQHLKLIAVLEPPNAPDGGADLATPADLAPAPPPDLLPSFQWVLDTSMSFPSLETVWGTSPTNLYVAGRSSKIFHFDGNSWGMQSSGKTIVNEIHGASASHIYAACQNGIAFSTGDGTWTIQLTGTDITDIFDLATTSQIASGILSSELFRSTGNGSWTPVANPPDNLGPFWASSPTNLYAGGLGLSTPIWHSIDGSSFSPEATGGSGSVTALFGTSATDVWAIQGDSVWHSTGTGTWQQQRSGLPTSGFFEGIGGLPGDYYVVGTDDVVHSTGDGVWTKEALPVFSTSVALSAVFVAGPTDVWVVGGNGTVGVVLHKFVTR